MELTVISCFGLSSSAIKLKEPMIDLSNSVSSAVMPAMMKTSSARLHSIQTFDMSIQPQTLQENR